MTNSQDFSKCQENTCVSSLFICIHFMFLGSKPPDMSKVENSCPKAEKVKKNDQSRPGYSRLFRTALSSSGQLSEVPKLPKIVRSSKTGGGRGEKRNNLEYKTSQIVLRCSRIFFSKPNSINVGKRIDLFRFFPLIQAYFILAGLRGYNHSQFVEFSIDNTHF